MRLKRMLPLLLAGFSGFLPLTAGAGCGPAAANPSPASPRTVVEPDALQKPIDKMRHTAFTLAVTGNGVSFFGLFPAPGSSSGAGSQAKYSQDGKGSWRIDYASESLIFNAGKKKVWYVKGKTAWEYSIKQQTQTQLPANPAENSSPLSLIFSMAPPRTGPNAVKPKMAGAGGVWEWDDLSHLTWEGPIIGGTGGMTSSGEAVAAPPPAGAGTSTGKVMTPPPFAGATRAMTTGQGASTSSGARRPPSQQSITLRMEFKGPGGLLSLIVATNPGGAQKLIFNYTNVSDVPENDFQLPAAVKEVRIPAGPNSQIPSPYMLGAPGS